MSPPSAPFSILRRNLHTFLSPMSKSTHIERTAHNQRHSKMMPLRIAEIRELSPSVKGFKMQLTTQGRPRESFLPGQWMDLFIPQIDAIGGYSMASEPSKFEKEGVIDLAIKYSTWAPALWMHTEAKVDDEFTFRFGGDYHYPHKRINTEEPHRLVLIAGGVGINPLASIARHVHHNPLVETHLLYSSRTEEELIFKEDLDALAAEKNSSLSVEYFITSSGPRISPQDLERAASSERTTYYYLCGPSSMIKEINGILLRTHVPKNQIFYELWT